VSLLSISFCKQPEMFGAANPWEDQAPFKILTRQYKIGEFTITPVWSNQQYQFPQALMNVPAIQKALSSFYWFRSDIEISVKLNSTPYHQGMMMQSFWHDNYADGRWTLFQRSALSPVLYNYSTSDSATSQIGWLHPEVYMPLNAPSNYSYIGTITLSSVVPLANTSGGTESIACTVYARFINPKTAGFKTQAPAVGQAGKVFKFTYTPESEEKSESHMPTSNAVEPFLAPLFKSVPLIGDTISGVMDAFSALTKMRDKPSDISTPQRMQYSIGDDLIHGTGLSLTNRLTLYPTSRLADFPIAPMCHTSNMSMTELAMIPMLHSIYTFDATHTTKNLYAHPYITDLGFSQFGGDPCVEPDYLAYVTAMHRFWRGGIKYYMYFVTNSFTTARLRISYIVDYLETDLAYGGDFPSQILDIKGSTVNKITIPYLYQTAYKITKPATALPDWNWSPKISIELLSLPTTSQGSAPKITMVVYRAAAEDFQVASPCTSIMFPTDMYPTPTGQVSLQDEFKFKFPAITCNCKMATEQGFTTTETVGKISDLLKRFARADGTENINQGVPKPGENDNYENSFLVGPNAPTAEGIFLHPYYQLIQLFKYQRGSMRFKYIHDGAIPAESVVYFTPSLGPTDGGSGDIAWIRSMNPVITIEAPWIGTVPYLPTEQSSIYVAASMNVVDFANTEMTDVSQFVAIGDDRLLSYLMPPPRFVESPAPLAAKSISTNTTNTSKNTPELTVKRNS
jgi:hypothetical protein